MQTPKNTLIIVDDEEDSLNVAKLIVQKNCPNIEIIAVSTFPLRAIKLINNLKPDILLLDINMPVINGFELLEAVSDKNFALIFLTAHDEYAIKAIKLSALDYLLKPIKKQELITALDKACQEKNKIEDKRLKALLLKMEKNRPGIRVALPTKTGLIFINVIDIIMAKAENENTIFFTKYPKEIVVNKSIGLIEDMLEEDSFYRIHRSFIVNIKYIEKVNVNEFCEVIMTNGQKINVARLRKKGFLEAIKKYNN